MLDTQTIEAQRPEHGRNPAQLDTRRWSVLLTYSFKIRFNVGFRFLRRPCDDLSTIRSSEQTRERWIISLTRSPDKKYTIERLTISDHHFLQEISQTYRHLDSRPSLPDQNLLWDPVWHDNLTNTVAPSVYTRSD